MGAQVADGRGWAVVAITESFEAVTSEADDYCCSDASFDAVSPWFGFGAGFSISFALTVHDVVERGPYAREVEYQSRRAYAFAPKPHL